ncbi:MAG: hypothetical protein ABL994_24645, partial [Verrucomicrobiales bacterium]
GETIIVREWSESATEIRPTGKVKLGPMPAPGLYREQISVDEAFFSADAEIEQDFSRTVD